MKVSPTLQQRLTENTLRQENGCLLWVGHSRTRQGYGVISIATGKVRLTHHAAFYLAHNRWAERLRHTCDNPGCCEPTHLLEGSQKQNMEDKVARGRQAKGEGHGMAKLTDAQVAAMRKLRQDGALFKELAEQFNTSVSNAHSICSGHTR